MLRNEIRTINDIMNIMIDYINRNKEKNNIEYQETIDALKEALNELERDYKEVE